MKYIKTFGDRDDFQKFDYSDMSEYIREEISLGNSIPYSVQNNLYKSGDYICSSFKIGERDVIVSSIIINDSDTICVNGGRNYKTLSDYLLQFNIKTDKYLYVGFGEYLNGVYNYDKNVNDNERLFRKMTTIIDIIKSMVSYHKINYIIFKPIDNDLSSGLKDKFYELFLSYNNVDYKKIKQSIDINGEIIQDFFILLI